MRARSRWPPTCPLRKGFVSNLDDLRREMNEAERKRREARTPAERIQAEAARKKLEKEVFSAITAQGREAAREKPNGNSDGK